MDIQYQYIFEKHGQVQYVSENLPNEIWIDVGSRQGSGSFDHHHKSAHSSSFSALLENKKHLAAVKEAAQKLGTLMIHLHEQPDLDCIFCLYAIHYYMAPGVCVDAPIVSDEIEKKLQRCIDTIDSGSSKIITRPTLYAIYSACGDLRKTDADADLQLVDAGLQLLALAVRAMSRGVSAELTELELAPFCKEAGLFQKELEQLSKKSFQEEFNKKVNVERIPVWTKDGNMEQVKAAIWRDIAQDSGGHVYAREQGCLLTVVPYAIRGKYNSDTTRVIIALDPKQDPEHRYTLRPFAELCEQMEQLEEQKEYSRTLRYRRPHGTPRANEGILSEAPFATTSDPWYLAPAEDLMDIPGAYSLLDYEDLLAILRSSATNVRRYFVMDAAGGILSSGQGKPISAWQAQMQEVLQTADGFRVLFAEMDSALIRHSNQILEAFCMNVQNRPYHDLNSSRFLHPDYATCIYTDLNTMIILTAVPGEQDYAKWPVGKLLPREKADIADAPLMGCIRTALTQRTELLAFSEQISAADSRKSMEKTYADVLAFLSRIQKEDAIRDPVLLEIYSFVQERLGIPSLKSSVVEKTNLMVSETRYRMVSRFNSLSAYAVPFILLGTLFQIGLLRFDAWLVLTGERALWGWLGCLTVLGGFMLSLFWRGRRKHNTKRKKGKS